MLYAIVDGKKTHAFPCGRGMCPFCKKTMIAKCGLIVIWHWAHRADESCLAEYEGETPWHLFYKSLVRPDRAEVIVEYNDKKRIMDILGNDNTPMEFQHSSITAEEIQKREKFYGMYSSKMVWIFDIREDYDSDRFIINQQNRNYRTFRWKYARRTVAQCKFPVFLQIHDRGFIELRKMYIDWETGCCGGWGYYRTLEWFLHRYLSKIFSDDTFDKASSCVAHHPHCFYPPSREATRIVWLAIESGGFGVGLSLGKTRAKKKKRRGSTAWWVSDTDKDVLRGVDL